MDENAGVSDRYGMASAWPPFVALGVPIAELGILFDLFPVAVGGLVLFSGSVAGLLDEAGYVRSPWLALGVMAIVLVAVGAGMAFTSVGLVTRGYAVIVAGGLLLAGAAVGELFVDERSAPV
ncbi:MAG: cox cluster protein [Haloferacaceae archaeon]